MSSSSENENENENVNLDSSSSNLNFKSSLYCEDEELNPLGHEIISRKIELVVPDNLNWPSKKIKYLVLYNPLKLQISDPE